MKRLNALIPILALTLFVFSCETPAVETEKESYSFYLTGVKESISYQFENQNGRAESTPEEVRSLTIIIVDWNKNVVFEQRYFNYGYYDNGYGPENEIPDTVYIPSLPEGEYSIMASTTDFYYYYWDGVIAEDGNVSTDSVDFDPSMYVIDSWLSSEGPIFVGYEEINLVEEGQEVVFEMSNISSKVKVQLAEGQTAEEYVYISFESSKNYSYSMNTGEFFDNGDYGYFGTYLGPYYYWDYPADESIEYLNSNSVYVLPRTIDKIYIEIYNEYGYYVTTSVELENGVEINTGDVITFTVDMDAIIGGSGAGSGVFSWEEIIWNDLGEVSIP